MIEKSIAAIVSEVRAPGCEMAAIVLAIREHEIPDSATSGRISNPEIRNRLVCASLDRTRRTTRSVVSSIIRSQDPLGARAGPVDPTPRAA